MIRDPRPSIYHLLAMRDLDGFGAISLCQFVPTCAGGRETRGLPLAGMGVLTRLRVACLNGTPCVVRVNASDILPAGGILGARELTPGDRNS